MNKKIKDITGAKYNKLTAIKFVGLRMRYDSRNDAIWLWRCDCGNEVELLPSHVNKGARKSCGCHVVRGPKMVATAVYRNNYKDGDLTLEQFIELSQKPCFYCGAEKLNKRIIRGQVFEYNGLDKKDQSKPHNLDNVVPCCWPCNDKKSDSSIHEFIEWIRTVNEKTKDLQL